MEKEIIIHIGLPKTGTTFLQKKIFPFIQGVFTKNYEEVRDDNLENPIACLLTSSFVNFSEQEMAEFKHKWDEYLELQSESKIFLSSEAFMYGNSWSYKKEVHEKIFNTLKDFFPNAKIFLVVRRQETWMDSIYNHCHRTYWPKFKTINEFFGYKDESFTSETKNINVKNLDWYKLVKYLEELFSKENLFILPYEMFKENPDEFLRKFYEHYNIELYFPKIDEQKINSKDKFHQLFLYRLYSYFRENLVSEKIKIVLRKNDKNFLKFLSMVDSKIKVKTPKLSQVQKDKVMDIHRESNKKLSEYTGMDLSKYG